MSKKSVNKLISKKSSLKAKTTTPAPSKPKILIYDVETSPVLAWTFHIGHEVSINHDQILEGQKFDILCICYKWLGENQIHSLNINLKTMDSSKMIDEFTKIVESADLVVAHNGDQFDMRQMNTQRFLHGQPPIDWPTSEDTLKQIRKHFYLASNKLDYLSKVLLGAGKDSMCLQDWVDIVLKKDKKALAKMIKYCKRDVKLLSGVYEKILPYCKPKINVSLVKYNDSEGCKRCGSTDMHKDGVRVSLSGKTQRLRCRHCGSVFSAVIKKNGKLGRIK